MIDEKNLNKINIKKPLRILCFHGYMTNSELMKY